MTLVGSSKGTNTEPPKWVFKKNTWYEFTINFSDQYQSNGRTSLENRYSISRKAIYSTLSETEDIDYYLVPEVSMLQYGDSFKNSIPRIHYHGIMRFKTNLSILNFQIKTQVLLAKIGRYQFNDYRPKHWPEYCEKHKHIYELLEPYELKSMKSFTWPEDLCN